MESSKKSGTSDQTAIPIDWNIPDDMVRRYSNNMLVQRGPNEIYISFFDIPPPVIIGTEEEREKQIDNIKSAKANCVASIVISPDSLKNFVKVLQDTEIKLKEPKQ